MNILFRAECHIICLFILLPNNGWGQNCDGGGPSTFAKISSAVPRTTVQPVLLYATTRGTAITAECYNRCQASDDCAGFIVDYERASCFRVPSADMSHEYIPARNSNFFLKICLQVPFNCTKKAWPIEFAPNSELVGYQEHVIQNVADIWHCAQLCLTGATQYRYGPALPCYSAQFQHWSKTCTLSSENRRSKPEAFSPGVAEGIDYIENLCIAEPTTDGDGCWHEPIYNYTLVEVDLQIPNIDIEQCRERCEREEYFKCRGFTHKCSSALAYNSESVCYLHSDDTMTSGPLVPALCNTYVERLTCIDLKVNCSATSMMVTLTQKGFSGRMFAAGYSEECGVSAYNQDVTTLILPITTDPMIMNRCGIFIALSFGHGNRKLATAVIVVQRHPIIQTLGDRIVKVSCIAEDSTDRFPRPLFSNVTLDVSFGVAEPPIQSSIINEAAANISHVSPTARLRVLDLGRGGAEASETVLGEELELRIDIYSPFNTSVLRAGHLVASSGDERDSLLLLDERGCPPDPSTFPALISRDSNTLSALFKAFRFPSSPILKFSLILTICETICQPTDCGNGLTSWGRRRRAAEEENKQEVPLQLAIIVRSPDQSIEDIFNTTEIASMQAVADSSDNVCISWLAIVSVLLLFGVSQIIILAVYCFMYYRKRHKNTDEVSLDHDFQPRHVTWADQ